MNENTDGSKSPGPLESHIELTETPQARSKDPDGRILQILADQKALGQWHTNLEKLRRQNSSR